MIEPSHECLRAGVRVSARGDAWSVVSRTRHADCESLRLTRLTPDLDVGRAGESVAPGGERTLLLPFDRVTVRPTEVRPRVVSNHRWTRIVLGILAARHPFGSLARAAGARIDLLPFQMEPALAMLRHAHARVLIADEVGLGKTIQAGLVLSELSHHVDGCRSVIVTPAALREQWRGELSARFALDVVLADAAWLASASRDLPPDVNPWALPGIYLASLDFVKRPEVLRSLEDVTWDLFVLDEAHGAGTATARLSAASALGVRSRRVLLLTATPPDGDPPALAAITDIGRLPGDEPCVEFRRTRDAAGVAGARRTVLLQVRLSTAERRMHRLLERYTLMIWTEAEGRKDPRARLASAVLRKRALSSAWSLAASVRRRTSLLDSVDPEPAASQLLLPLDSDDTVDDDVSDRVLGAPGLADRETERALLGRIEACARGAAVRESKLAFLQRYLMRAREPAIVFTEYRDTLLHLERALRCAGFEPLLLHGGMLPRERTAVQQAFNERGMLLLATDAASEGLNLHARCRVVIHFELPWTPARLAQRTGRVDRLGQHRTVHEVLLVARHTAERVVLAPLVRRARIAGRRAGAGRGTLAALTESRITQAVMEGRPLPVPETEEPVPMATLDLRAEAHREVERIVLERRFGHDVIPTTRPVVTVRKRPASGSLTLVYLVTLENHQGGGVHNVIVPLAFDMRNVQPPRRAHDQREMVRRFEAEHGAQVSLLVESSASADVGLATAQHAAALERLRRRERGIGVSQLSTAQWLVQPGLFDRRAVLRADARRCAAALLAVDTDSAAAATIAATSLASRVTLVAVRLNVQGAG